MLFIPLVGSFIAFSGYRKTKFRSHEFAGIGLAKTGLALCLVTLGVGSSYHLYTYGTEVPDGYKRVSFLSLQPLPEKPDLPISPSAIDLNGKKVFLKGYVLSDEKGKGLKKFVLVPDLGACCFGATQN